VLQIRICDRVVRKEGCDRPHGMKGGKSSRYDAHLLRSEGIQNCREADQEGRVKRKELLRVAGGPSTETYQYHVPTRFLLLSEVPLGTVTFAPKRSGFSRIPRFLYMQL
jgi:hypothetical protein